MQVNIINLYFHIETINMALWWIFQSVVMWYRWIVLIMQIPYFSGILQEEEEDAAIGHHLLLPELAPPDGKWSCDEFIFVLCIQVRSNKFWNDKEAFPHVRLFI